MPEHVHLLISEPKLGTPSRTLQVLKQKYPQDYRRHTRIPASGNAASTISMFGVPKN
jgi:REP element-mobilizing transposase RayT